MAGVVMVGEWQVLDPEEGKKRKRLDLHPTEMWSARTALGLFVERHIATEDLYQSICEGDIRVAMGIYVRFRCKESTAVEHDICDYRLEKCAEMGESVVASRMMMRIRHMVVLRRVINCVHNALSLKTSNNPHAASIFLGALQSLSSRLDVAIGDGGDAEHKLIPTTSAVDIDGFLIDP